MITPQFHYSLFSHRMRFPAVTGGLFLPQNFPFQHPVNENCAEAQFNGQNDQFTPATAFHGDSTPAPWLYPTPRCPLNVLLNEALIAAWYIPRLPDKSLTKLPSLFTFTRLSSTNSLRTAAFSQGSFPYRSPGACCNSALHPVHDIYCGYRLISIPCHWINDSSV